MIVSNRVRHYQLQILPMVQLPLQDSSSIALGFSARLFGAMGSLSTTRTDTRSAAKSDQSYIYNMELSCTKARASITDLSSSRWDLGFLNAMKILPESYAEGDDLDNFVEFWETYGTHMMKSVKLGGSIVGSIVANKCSVQTSFGSASEYEVCLNAAYKGVLGSPCAAVGSSSLQTQSVETAIESKRIVVKGGDSSFSDIFTNFEDKSADFDDWINTLQDHPYVVGGNLDEIQDAILVGNHSLNLGLPRALSDDEWMRIAEA